MKGLFCCLSAQGIHSFASYGLFRQAILSKASGESLDVFKPPWYSRPVPRHRPKKSPRHGPSIDSDIDVPLMTERRDNNSQGDNVAFRMAGEQRSHPPLHFSRKISLSNLTNRDPTTGLKPPNKSSFNNAKEDADLPYLVLCRVILHRTLDVFGPIRDADISRAMEEGYDSVHAADRYIIIYCIAAVSHVTVYCITTK